MPDSIRAGAPWGAIKQNYVLALGVNSAGILEGALAHWAHHANDQGRRR